MSVSSEKPLRLHITPFLEYCEIEKGLTNSTQRNYGNYLQVFTRWLERVDKQSALPHEITADDIWQYRLYLAQKYKTRTGTNLSKQSQNLYLSALRSFLKYLNEREIEALPYSKVSLAKHSAQDTVTFLNVDDIEAIFNVPDIATKSGLRDRAILELLFSSGMRIAELVSLEVDQLKMLKKPQPGQTYELPIVGKGKRTRTVFISPRAADWLIKYLKTRHDVLEPLFINYRNGGDDGRRLSARSIQRLVSRTATMAGINKEVTPHTIRHSYATDLLSHGADLRAVQELLGHKNVATTQVYTHVTNKYLRDIHERHHGGNDKRLN